MGRVWTTSGVSLGTSGSRPASRADGEIVDGRQDNMLRLRAKTSGVEAQSKHEGTYLLSNIGPFISLGFGSGGVLEHGLL